ncbi:MAG: LysM peptidoglycan-binding domain-containing protein [Planctomycetota bacterium]
MRTAEQIVREYRERGYDTFRIRAIAALRPEPMRSQILERLDAESANEQPAPSLDASDSQVLEAAISDAPVDAPVEAEEKVVSAVFAVIGEDAPVTGGGQGIEVDARPADAVPPAGAAEAEYPEQTTGPLAAGEESSVLEITEDMILEDAEASLADAEEDGGGQALSEEAPPEPDAAETGHDPDTLSGAEETAEVRAEANVPDAGDGESAEEALEAPVASEETEAFWEADSESEDCSGSGEFEPVCQDAEEAGAESDEGGNGSAPAAEEAVPEIMVDEEGSSYDLMGAFARVEREWDEHAESRETYLREMERAMNSSLSEAAADARILIGAIETAEAERDAVQIAADARWEPDAPATVDEEADGEEEDIGPMEADATDGMEGVRIVFPTESHVPEDAPEMQDARWAAAAPVGEQPSADEASSQTTLFQDHTGDAPLHLVQAEDSEAETEESKIIEIATGAPATDAPERSPMRLVGGRADDEDSWFDFGNGYIVVPRSMHDAHEAYRAASGDGEEEAEASDKAAASASAIDPAAWRPTVPVRATAPESGDQEALRRELAELELSLRKVEARLHTAREECGELEHLLGQKDELLGLQQSQVDELRSDLARREAQITELEGAQRRLRHIQDENLAMQARLDEMERERNVLKTETVPALEEQQLNLVDIIEEENRAHEETRQRLRSAKRARSAGFGVAAVACLCAVLLPALNMVADLPLLPTEIREEQNRQIALVADEKDEVIDTYLSRIDALESRLETLQAGHRAQQASWKETEGQLRRQLAQVRDERTERHASLTQELASLQRERDDAIRNFALAEAQLEEFRTRRSTAAASNPGGGVGTVQPTAAGGEVRTRQAGRGAYTVKAGDVLSRIVEKHYGTTRNGELTRRVARENGLGNPNEIYPGQQLRLAVIELE